MLYREIMAVCSEIHTKHVNTLCGQNVDLLNVKLVVRIVSHYPFRKWRLQVVRITWSSCALDAPCDNLLNRGFGTHCNLVDVYVVVFSTCREIVRMCLNKVSLGHPPCNADWLCVRTAHDIRSNVLVLGPVRVRRFLPTFIVTTTPRNSVTRLRCAEVGIPASCRATKNLQSDIISLPIRILRGFSQSFGKTGHLVHPWGHRCSVSC